MLVLPCAVPAAEPPGLLLTRDPTELAGWRSAPPLASMVWRPDLLLRTGSRTIESAAERLASALAAAPEAPGWVRLDCFDLTAVGDCETCQPPPLDPHAYRPLTTPVALDPRQYRFFGEVAERLRGTRFQPVVVVPAGGEPPEQVMPDNLLFLLAGPSGPAGFGQASLAARLAQSAAWQAAGLWHANLIADGLADFFGLPLNGDLLRPQADRLPYPAVLARDAATLDAAGPAWLTARLRAVLVDGQTTPQGEPWRPDEPLLAQAVDVFAPAMDRLGETPGELLAAATLRALRAVEEWDQARAAGEVPDTAGTVAALTARSALRHAWEPDGTLSARFASYLAAAGPLPVLSLPPVPATITFDSLVEADEWRGTAVLNLAVDRFAHRPHAGDRLVGGR